MKTYFELISELEKLAKPKSQALFRQQQRDRKRKDPGGLKKKIQNKKYRLSAKGKKNAAITKRLDDRGIARQKIVGGKKVARSPEEIARATKRSKTTVTKVKKGGMERRN